MDLASLTTAGWFLYAAIGVLGLGLVLFLTLLLGGGGNKKELSAEERVALYTTDRDRVTEMQQRAASDQALAQVRGAADAMLKRNRTLEEKIASRLESAGMDWRASEWLLLHVGIVVGAGLLGLVLGGGAPVTGILFVLMGAAGPWLFLKLKRSRRLKAFSSQLPDTLQLMSGSMSAGLSLAQSIDTVAREGSEPMAGEFKRVLVEARLGVNIEEALSGVAERFQSKDFEWIVMAIKIQREVGGNLGELLDTVAKTIREREYMRRQVASLAAEGKLSAYVIGGLPPLFFIYLLLTRPEYVGVMFTNPLGWLMLGGGIFMLGIGAFWMSRLVKVEV